MMDKLKQEKLKLHEVASWYIIEKNNFNKKINALEK